MKFIELTSLNQIIELLSNQFRSRRSKTYVTIKSSKSKQMDPKLDVPKSGKNANLNRSLFVVH